MSFKYIAIAAALAVSPAALAQAVDSPAAQPQAGETSDRTPEQVTPTPSNQQDTSGDKTSDRSPDKDAKVQHQPGAAGTGGSSSEGASSGEAGSNLPPKSDSNTMTPPAATPPAAPAPAAPAPSGQ